VCRDGTRSGSEEGAKERGVFQSRLLLSCERGGNSTGSCTAARSLEVTGQGGHMSRHGLEEAVADGLHRNVGAFHRDVIYRVPL